jgi:hypothetical protein
VVCVLAVLFAPARAGAVSLVVDRLGTPDLVQAGDRVAFSFAFQLDPGETLLATQARISAPQLSGFAFTKARDPWDLSAEFRQMNENRDGDPMWVYAENIYGEDAPGVTWDEVAGVAPLGRFSATATYNGEIVFDLSSWELLMLDDTHVPLAAAWEHFHTGVTIAGGADLPPPPPPSVATPPPAAPVPVPPPAPEIPEPVPAPQTVIPGFVSMPVPVSGWPDRTAAIEIDGAFAPATLGMGPGFAPAVEDVRPSCRDRRGCVRLTTRDALERRGFVYPARDAADLGGALPEPGIPALLALGLLGLSRRARR